MCTTTSSYYHSKRISTINSMYHQQRQTATTRTIFPWMNMSRLLAENNSPENNSRENNPRENNTIRANTLNLRCKLSLRSGLTWLSAKAYSRGTNSHSSVTNSSREHIPSPEKTSPRPKPTIHANIILRPKKQLLGPGTTFQIVNMTKLETDK